MSRVKILTGCFSSAFDIRYVKNIKIGQPICVVLNITMTLNNSHHSNVLGSITSFQRNTLWSFYLKS